MSNIITITTDFGLEDYFVGVMKGVMLSINPDARLVDLNNNIDKHDILKAAVSLNNSYYFFPSGSVHLVVVDPGVGSSRKPVTVKAGDHYFVGPDNGVFTLIYKKYDSFEVREITNSSCMLDNISSTFHGRDIFAPAAAHVSVEKKIDHVGGIVNDPVTINLNYPSVTDSGIIGKVVYKDIFGNLITNIKAEMIDGKDIVRISGVTIPGISCSYSDVAKGYPVALIGSSGYLEIAVNMGNAAEYFGGDQLDVEVIKSGSEIR